MGVRGGGSKIYDWWVLMMGLGLHDCVGFLSGGVYGVLFPLMGSDWYLILQVYGKLNVGMRALSLPLLFNVHCVFGSYVSHIGLYRYCGGNVAWEV